MGEWYGMILYGMDKAFLLLVSISLSISIFCFYFYFCLNLNLNLHLHLHLYNIRAAGAVYREFVNIDLEEMKT